MARHALLESGGNLEAAVEFALSDMDSLREEAALVDALETPPAPPEHPPAPESPPPPPPHHEDEWTLEVEHEPEDNEHLSPRHDDAPQPQTSPEQAPGQAPPPAEAPSSLA